MASENVQTGKSQSSQDTHSAYPGYTEQCRGYTSIPDLVVKLWRPREDSNPRHSG